MIVYEILGLLYMMLSGGGTEFTLLRRSLRLMVLRTGSSSSGLAPPIYTGVYIGYFEHYLHFPKRRLTRKSVYDAIFSFFLLFPSLSFFPYTYIFSEKKHVELILSNKPKCKKNKPWLSDDLKRIKFKEIWHRNTFIAHRKFYNRYFEWNKRSIIFDYCFVILYNSVRYNGNL